MWFLLKQKSSVFAGKDIGTRVELDEADAAPFLTSGVLEKSATDPVKDAMAEVLKGFREDCAKTVMDAFADGLKAAQAQMAKGGVTVPGFTGAKDLTIDGNERYGFDNLGDFSQHVKAACNNGASMSEKLEKYVNAMEVQIKAASGMNETVGEEGGFTIPPVWSDQIKEKVFAEDSILASTDAYTATVGNTMSFHVLREDSRADGSRHGGLLAYWAGEAAQMTKTKPLFDELALKLNKLHVLAYMTDELMEDGPMLGQYLTRKAGEAIKFKGSDAVIEGDGIGKPLGILSGACLIKYTRTITLANGGGICSDDVIGMKARLHASMWANSAWYINQEVEPDLMKMSIGVKNVLGTENVGGLPAYMPPNGLSASPYGTLFGRPVIPVEYCSARNTAGDIILANFKDGYVTLAKGGVKSAMSMHLRFDYDETAFRFTYRMAGQPWWPKALTPFKGTNTLSPFVTLTTAA